MAADDIVMLASNGEAQLAIWSSDDCSEAVDHLASTLAKQLERISGAEFSTTSNATEQAIRLIVTEGASPAVLEREAYTIRSGEDGLTLTGVTELALQHAVWDLLYRIGYRQFFPGKNWEIVPQLDTVSVAINVEESPDYASRRIWYGYSFWDHNRAAWESWVEKNRMGGGFQLNTGHAYGQLIRSQQASFDAHPEYYALVDGKRHVNPQAKLCISNPGVLKAAVAYALDYFENNPNADSVSVDPSDGGNWCECEECTALGPPNDLALLLANTVAEAVRKKVGEDRYVGMYAYSYHSPPPSIDVHSNVIISTATGFIKGGLKIEEIISGWSQKGATIGIREYYSVHTWDRDLPGASRGSNLKYLSETIPKFHKMEARFLSAESSDNWGCNGLGYYFASRLMWDTHEAKKREEIVDDFLEKCFGPAEQPARQFYELIDGSNEQANLVFDDLLARMFRLLNEAHELASDAKAVTRRIDDLILYTRYVELFDSYRNASGKERQAAYEQLIRHAYRMRSSFMVHVHALWRDLAHRDKSISNPENADWKIPENENPWKSSAPFTRKEIDEFLASGMSHHSPIELDFVLRQFDDENLTIATSIHDLAKVPPGKASSARGLRSWFTVVENVPAEIELTITGGMIKHYRDRGNVKVQLWKLGGVSQTGERKTLIAEESSVPPDGKPRTIKLIAKEPGTYRIDLNDGGDMTTVTWPAGQAMSWKMTLDDHPQSMSGRWHLYFYVPKGTKRIGLYTAASDGTLRYPDGKNALELKRNGGGFLSADVPEGMDGQLWKLHFVAGKVCLLNVPPFLSRSAEELVLPAE